MHIIQSDCFCFCESSSTSVSCGGGGLFLILPFPFDDVTAVLPLIFCVDRTGVIPDVEAENKMYIYHLLFFSLRGITS